jgi:hypothetical protein
MPINRHMTFSDRQAEAARTKKLQRMPPAVTPAPVPQSQRESAPDTKAAASKPAKTVAKAAPPKAMAAAKKSNPSGPVKGK